MAANYAVLYSIFCNAFYHCYVEYAVIVSIMANA